ncbi:SCF ubiquitin ligase complex subunit [Purpureocillium takamizusanense]|uniref:SCF ubiquitin ligase complex subunit n=1 Tax=Purpureocillium takamizusanense TaxID=2060973 RepID=A0A9Q8VAG6_9HYPO|nr:SCF ubiquitin ligase complex subunit [Purpureocillium takamizusanense]UNI17777.1 SCF ubiquitin ligase complex subunit [Purpureocillium takamizusanense]
MATRSARPTDDQDDSRSSSSTTSPAPADNEESDFFLGANDSQSSLGVPNFQDMQVDDACWPPVSRLPNEILISIFAKLSASSDLYHCMLVSKRWARNAVDLLWHRPACTNWRNHSSICQTLGLEHPFFSYRDFIKRLNLASLADRVNDGSVQPLAVCTRVERLTLTNCRGLTDSGLISLVENSASLLALDISNDKNITEQSINAIAEHCRRLQGLNISGCEAISNESMITLAQSCKYIKRLKLNECGQLRDNAILAFAEHCPNILEIDLYQCFQIGNGPVTALLSRGNCLRELRLASCDLIDDNAFLSLPEGQTYEHLRILDLTSCTRLTDAAVAKIIDAAPRLRNLVLAKCRNITDAAVNAISKLGKNLHYVHLGHCGQITDEGVKKLVGSCNRIRYIDLGCCTNLTDDSVKRLAMLPKLKRIGLVKCSSITDDSVFALAEAAFRPRVRRDASGVFIGGEYYASSLERVHLSYCVNLTLRSVMRLLNSCPRLTHLSLTGVAAFQRDDFQAFCRVAPPEFTQHQRDVFCVFSGSMVSQFREFLNTSSRFQELRDSLPYRSGGSRARGAAARRSNAMASNLPTAEGEGFDDEMADEENDFEGMDGSEMVVDAQAQNQHQHGLQHNPPLPQAAPTIPIPPPAPSLSQHPFTDAGPGNPVPAHPYAYHPSAYHPPAPLGPLAFSSFISNESASGAPPLSAHGHMSASMAPLSTVPSPPSLTASTANGPPTTASTAPVQWPYHQDPLGE